MENWEKKLDETLQQKQQERKDSKLKDEELEGKKESNYKEAMSFISKTIAPAFARATGEMHKHDMFAQWRQLGNDGTSMSIEAHKQGINVPRDRVFEYRIDMHYDPNSVELNVQCSYKGTQSIKAAVEISEISEVDIYNDVWSRFIGFAKQKL